MKRWEAWSVHGSTILVGATGLVYAWMRYLMEPADPYAVVNHPLQPQAQHLHVLVAPLLVFAAGLIWKNHVWSHFTVGVARARRSGISLLLTLAPMVVSGYLIQTTITEAWRNAWIVIHCATSAVWLVVYTTHAIAATRRRRNGRRRRQDEGQVEIPAPS